MPDANQPINGIPVDTTEQRALRDFVPPEARSAETIAEAAQKPIPVTYDKREGRWFATMGGKQVGISEAEAAMYLSVEGLRGERKR